MKLPGIGLGRTASRSLLMVIQLICQAGCSTGRPAAQTIRWPRSTCTRPDFARDKFLRRLSGRVHHGCTAVTLKLVGFVAALTLSTCVSAIGMGGINVVSALGQPLKADIELVAVTRTEKTSMVARLASPDAYRGAGLEYPYGSKFKFQIEHRANGELYINVSSAQPINDPFVSLLVELTWASGKLLREYTFLIDPPGYVAEQPKLMEVQAVTPSVQPASSVVAAKPAGEPYESAPVPEEGKSAGKPAEVSAKPDVTETKDAAAGSITVHRGDTLARIAMKNKPSEVSLERMLVALYRANADQFDGHNMNRISVGKILRLPAQGELTNVTQSDAAREIYAHTANWKVYRQKLATSASASAKPQIAGQLPTSAQPQDTRQVATGKIASSVADNAPVAKDNAREVLKLSKGETPGDKAATGAAVKPVTAQDKKNAELDDATARSKSLKEEQARIALLEKNLQDMQRLAQMKSEAAALAQSRAAASAVAAASRVAAASAAVAAPRVTAVSAVAASTAVAASAVVATPKVAAVSAVAVTVAATSAVAAPKVAAASSTRPAPVVKPAPAAELSLIDQILEDWLYPVGGVLILLGLAGGAAFLWKRRKLKAASDEDADANNKKPEVVTGRITEPVVPSPDTGDFTGKPAVDSMAKLQSDDVDPISEADLFLNFGRDAQAEEILKEALQKTPNNHLIHLKLLSIYSNRKDKDSFAAIAQQLKDVGDEDAWVQTVAMGHKLDPHNPLYGEAKTDNSVNMRTTMLKVKLDSVLNDMKSTQVLAVPDVDFDLSDRKKKPVDPLKVTQELPVPAVDFDLSENDQPTDAKPAAKAHALDFDFDMSFAKPKAAAVDFDLNDSPTTPSPKTPEKMDLDIASVGSAKQISETATFNLDAMNFDVDGIQPFAAGKRTDEPATSKPTQAPQAENDGMEFTLDFKVDDAVEKPAPAPAPAPEPVETGFADINLSFEDAATPAKPAEKVKDAHWHEVATKFDLVMAYQEMGDATAAREILEEILSEGDGEQRELAQSMLDQLG